MFTPQEVSEKVFPKASFGSGGYSMTSVDEFLDALTEDYTALFKENMTLKAKLKVLAEKVEEYRSTEEAMRQALLTAQKMASKLVQEAQAEKEQLLADARTEAQNEIHRLDAERQGAEQKLAMAQQKTAEFIRRSQELCQAQTDFLQSLPELELAAAAPEQPAAAEEKPNDDVISAIEQDILSRYTDPQPEEAKPAVTDEPTIKLPPIESAIPSDFKLSLDELKFGRNYGDKK
ncbi:MAG: DivIVA domain-containing protein [Clostridiales bacterium]|nr:DivIVA domain-containing protein [Clostridiales bacterium]